MQLILCKDNASERNVSLLANSECSLSYTKIMQIECRIFSAKLLKIHGKYNFPSKNPPLTILFFLRPLPLVLNILYSQLFFYHFRHMY